MEVRRFGPGHRKPEGPPGSRGVTGQVIHADGRGVVAELAFQPYAMIAPHANPNTTYFIVISGGGFVQVGAERSRVNHGEAVVWPAGELHGAYTDGSEMRALVVEFRGADDSSPGMIEGGAVELPPDVTVDRKDDSAGEPGSPTNAGARGGTESDRPWSPDAARSGRHEGGLAERPILRRDYDASTGEPW